jgi:hypothetical protein
VLAARGSTLLSLVQINLTLLKKTAGCKWARTESGEWEGLLSSCDTIPKQHSFQVGKCLLAVPGKIFT